MKTIHLTSRQRQAISDRRRHAQDRRIYQRLSAILWSDDGRAREEIAELVAVSTRQVGQWFRIFRNKGLDELCTLHHQGDPGRLGPSQVGRLRQEIERGVFHDAEQIRNRIEATFGVPYSAPGVKDLLRRIGASFHKVSGFFSGRPMSRSRSGSCGSTAGTSVRRGRGPGGTSWTPATRSGAWTCSIAAGC
jgi:transposase